MSDQAKFCGTCGVQLPAAGGFCGACGAGNDSQVLIPDSITGEAPQVQSNNNNKKAIWSLGAGILGLVISSLLLGGVAIYLSRTAKKEIIISGESGNGMATAGLILGILSVVSIILWKIYA